MQARSGAGSDVPWPRWSQVRTRTSWPKRVEQVAAPGSASRPCRRSSSAPAPRSPPRPPGRGCTRPARDRRRSSSFSSDLLPGKVWRPAGLRGRDVQSVHTTRRSPQTTSAVAIAATPSPRPVSPSPSVVVADTETGAPDRVARAPPRPRRGGRRAGAGCRSPGRRRCRSRSRRRAPGARSRRAGPYPTAPAHAGSDVPKLLPEVAEAGGGEQRVAGGVGGDVGVGVALEALRLVGPGQPGEVAVGTPSTRRCTSVPMPITGRARGSLHGPIMPERQSNGVRTSRGAWSLAGLVAGFAGSRDELLVAMAMTIRESPGRRGRPSWSSGSRPAPWPSAPSTCSGYWDKPVAAARHLRGPRAPSSPGPAGWRGGRWWAAADRLRAAAALSARSPWRSSRRHLRPRTTSRWPSAS